jgi:prepilin-type processing-associated H-X9-DG protein
VIAIIGVLVALLLPAVQAAREAARRMSCSNNVKNLVLAMHNYAEQNKQFPMGVRGLGSNYGHSWTVGIMPFIEQNNLYNNWKFGAFSFTDNDDQLNNLIIPIYRCPSSPLAKTITVNGFKIQQVNYVAIAGTTNSADSNGSPAPTFTYNGTTVAFTSADNRKATGTSGDGAGIISSNGMFHPDSQTTFGDLSRDGTSNTMFIGEQSDFMKKDGTTQMDATSCSKLGGFAGTKTAGIPGTVTTWDGSACAITTIRHAVNYKVYNSGQGTAEGGYNCGIQSAHGGGSMVGWGDGRVSFVNENMDIMMLFRAASRDDGLPVQLPDR